MINNEVAFNETLPAGYDGRFHWDFLLPAFSPTKSRPMDFDCVIERKGRFLCFETKEPGAEIPGGQRTALEAVVATGFWTVVFLEAKRGHEIRRWQVWRRVEDGSALGNGVVSRTWWTGSQSDLLAFVTAWFEWASSRRRPEIEVRDCPDKAWGMRR